MDFFHALEAFSSSNFIVLELEEVVVLAIESFVCSMSVSEIVELADICTGSLLMIDNRPESVLAVFDNKALLLEVSREEVVFISSLGSEIAIESLLFDD